MSQQPTTGKVNPAPHSSPGRFQFEPEWPSGPQSGWTVWPAGPRADRRRSPLPVIRQMILTCSPLGSGSAPPSSRAHNSPPVTVPRTSGGPPAPCHGVDGDGGLQPDPPNWPPATGVVGLEEGVETFEGDAEAPGGPVWQAVRTPARSIPATILTIFLLHRRGSARSAYPSDPTVSVCCSVRNHAQRSIPMNGPHPRAHGQSHVPRRNMGFGGVDTPARGESTTTAPLRRRQRLGWGQQ